MEKKTFRQRVKENPMLLKFFGIALLAPTLASMGMDYKDIKTWADAINIAATAIMNPYLLGSTIAGVYMFVKTTDSTDKKENQDADV